VGTILAAGEDGTVEDCEELRHLHDAARPRPFGRRRARHLAALRLTEAGKRWKTAPDVRGLASTVLGQKRITLGLESGDVCARRTLRCKVAGTEVRCR